MRVYHGVNTFRCDGFILLCYVYIIHINNCIPLGMEFIVFLIISLFITSSYFIIELYG